MKIEVVGFPKSGTTLTFNIFKEHPQIKNMIFEHYHMFRKGIPKGYNGEKNTWVKRTLGKAFKEKTIIDYLNKFADTYPEHRIIQIVRHPIDSWNSLCKARKRQNRFYYIDEQFDWYLDCVFEFIPKITSMPNTLTFKYEELVLNPEIMIPKLYSFCNLTPSYKFSKKMNQSRIFAYKKEGVTLKKDYSKVIDLFNKIKGPKYENI